jgi:dTDP-4-amino-4,6-dideoxygalactose transaminase
MSISFNKPHLTGKELHYISEAHALGQLSGDGPFTRRCNAWLEQTTGSTKALLTHSCTAALDMAAILADIAPGDEVVMPSYTFSSTANAFVLRGGVPVFVDIRPDTLNIDETKIEAAITSKTKAIVPVHYAGVSCEMDAIMAIADRHHLLVIEDAAQGIMSTYRGKPLGSIGHLGCLSFHETKNIIAGEGGALLINDSRLIERAEIVREKGTNRSKFFRGEVDKYTWVDVGSSYLPGEIVAAFLWAQMEDVKRITDKRLAIWNMYAAGLHGIAREGALRLPVVPAECKHNAHMFYVLFGDLDSRTRAIAYLRERGITTVFHYVPLHSSPAGVRFGRAQGDMTVTNDTGDRLLRLPLYYDMSEADTQRVIEALIAYDAAGRRATSLADGSGRSPESD